MAEREIEFLGEGLRRHVKALAVDIGPRTPFNGDSLERAAAYIQSAFEEIGLSVTEQLIGITVSEWSICLPRSNLLPNHLPIMSLARITIPCRPRLAPMTMPALWQ